VPTAAVLARRELHGHAPTSGGGWEEAGSGALRWSNPPRGSFDDFGQSMLVLYVMSSGDSWEKPMWIMMGASGSGHAAVRNDFSAASVYALAWMCMSYIFAINLFVGVVVDNFRRIQQQESGSASMTNEQQQWAATMKALANALPVKAQVPPKGHVRRICYHVITSQIFDSFITTAIIANIGVRVQSTTNAAQLSADVAAEAEQARSSKAGVNLDEEAARLIQYQQSYQAAAKMLQVAQSVFETLLQAAGR
jgi:hypothetical protein